MDKKQLDDFYKNLNETMRELQEIKTIEKIEVNRETFEKLKISISEKLPINNVIRGGIQIAIPIL